MRENCTYGSMRGRAFPTGRPALLYTLEAPSKPPFDFSPHGWWIRSDLGVVKL